MKDYLKRYPEKVAHKQPLLSENHAAPQVRSHTVNEEEAGQRIDNFLLRVCKGVPKSHIYRILRSGEVRVNKGRIKQTYRLEAGDVVRIPPIRVAQTEERKVPAGNFQILHEDKHLLIIDKPEGVAVHGGSGVSYGVIEQLRASRPEAPFLELVHRLDRGTSGILLVAKKRSALRHLQNQMREGTVDKRYLTLVSGDWENKRQHIKLPLHKYDAPTGEKRVKVKEGGMASHTIFNLLHRYGDYSLLEAELKTGRTHQIRVHLASSGYVIAGDDKYGDFALNHQLMKANNERGQLKRMFLHSHHVTFIHPETEEPFSIDSKLAPECANFLESLDKKG